MYQDFGAEDMLHSLAGISNAQKLLNDSSRSTAFDSASSGFGVVSA